MYPQRFPAPTHPRANANMRSARSQYAWAYANQLNMLFRQRYDDMRVHLKRNAPVPISETNQRGRGKEPAYDGDMLLTGAIRSQTVREFQEVCMKRHITGFEHQQFVEWCTDDNGRLSPYREPKHDFIHDLPEHHQAPVARGPVIGFTVRPSVEAISPGVEVVPHRASDSTGDGHSAQPSGDDIDLAEKSRTDDLKSPDHSAVDSDSASEDTQDGAELADTLIALGDGSAPPTHEVSAISLEKASVAEAQHDRSDSAYASGSEHGDTAGHHDRSESNNPVVSRYVKLLREIVEWKGRDWLKVTFKAEQDKHSGAVDHRIDSISISKLTLAHIRQRRRWLDNEPHRFVWPKPSCPDAETMPATYAVAHCEFPSRPRIHTGYREKGLGNPPEWRDSEYKGSEKVASTPRQIDTADSAYSSASSSADESEAKELKKVDTVFSVVNTADVRRFIYTPSAEMTWTREKPASPEPEEEALWNKSTATCTEFGHYPANLCCQSLRAVSQLCPPDTVGTYSI